MPFKPLSRRTLLRGAGGIAISLPFLEAMTSSGATTTFPTRFIGCANFDGTHLPSWTPTGTETSFSLSPILQPLSGMLPSGVPAWKKSVIIGGLDNEVSYHGPAPGGHNAGIAGLFSGAFTQAGNIYCGGGGCSGWGSGITIDQHIGQTVGKNDPLPALTLACQPMDVTVLSHMSYTGAAQPVSAFTSPLDVFNQLFRDLPVGGGDGGMPPPDPAGDALRARRKSVLDFVLRDLSTLQGKVSAADRVRLDAHTTALREVERELTSIPPAPPTGAVCTRPAAPGSLDYNASANIPQSSKLMIDLLTLALSCQLTRSVTLQWGRSTGGLTFPWLGINQGQHSISHLATGTGAPLVTQINTWFATQFFYLMQKLDAVQEGSGTLLDHSAIVWGNGLTVGNVHDRRNLPFVLAGGGSGAFRTGRFLKYNGVSHNNLLVSLLNATGVNVSSFGEAAYCTGPLSGLA